MAADVVQSFLQHAVDMHAGTRFDGEGLALLFVMHAESRLPLDRRNIPVQSTRKAGFLEEDWMQRLRKRANLIQAVLRDLANFLQILAKPAVLCRPAARAAQHRADRGEHLPELVVQLPRNMPQR